MTNKLIIFVYVGSDDRGLGCLLVEGWQASQLISTETIFRENKVEHFFLSCGSSQKLVTLTNPVQRVPSQGMQTLGMKVQASTYDAFKAPNTRAVPYFGKTVSVSMISDLPQR